MNARDLEIFLRGFHVGIKVANDLEAKVPQKENVKKTRNSRGKLWTSEEDLVILNKDLTMNERLELLPGRNKISIYNRLNQIKKNNLAKLGQ